ncbi:hypothetical protein M885DRAFT_584710 [Pelagophyceae sp. CCMP2097]|nr:hypothetical protein M885DRAFT_584710 [Pelagophyceae sp. CCMP2097]|mmetsp:Transcript_30519/g.104955  ORF Transcript_30519/g.104955 Transcript_30519/m.104955 type:complete len:593 (-) Transcript_30519:662-2440(-)
MVFLFEARAGAEANYVVYMGADKHENEGLIEWGWFTDVWFHVDGLSSAHVYLRVPLAKALCACTSKRCSCVLDSIPDETVEEMCQLVKNNSIEGCKKASVMVVFTPWSNLHKDETRMVTGSVGFHDSKLRRFRRVDKNKEIVKRIEKTKTEATPDLQRDKLAFDARVVVLRKQRLTEARASDLEQNGDSRKDALMKRQARDEFLASGGYHAPASSYASAPPPPPPASSVVFDDQLQTDMRKKAAGDAASGVDKGLDSLMSALDVKKGDVKKARPKPAATVADDEPARPQWQEEDARRAAESTGEAQWLRARGYGKAAVDQALLATRSKLDALARLYRADDADAGVGADDALLAQAAEERGEEHEALEAIFEDDLEALGEAGDFGLAPLPGFENAADASAPPLRFEFYASVAPAYPAGGAAHLLPVAAVVGGGLTEASLLRVTRALNAHALANADAGQLFFDLATLAAEEATTLLEQQALEAQRAAAKVAAVERAALLGTAAAAPPPAAEFSEEEQFKRDLARAKKASDAKARLGCFAEKQEFGRPANFSIRGSGEACADSFGAQAPKAPKVAKPSRMAEDFDDLIGVVRVAR